jgi:Ca2+-dependent lipid-binding protein
VWNDVFTFDIETGKEGLEVLVYDKDDFGKDDFLGRCEFNLEKYIDQQPHDEWFNLEGENPSVTW